MTPARRRTLSCALVAALLLPVLAAAAAPPAAAATPATPNLAGVWKMGEDVFFHIDQAAGATSITTQIINDTCTSGPRNYMITGTLDGIALNGTMQRCDEEDSILVTECGLSALWETPFTANVTEFEIVGERQGEYYVWDTDSEGHAVNCTLDYYFWADFSLSRVDCGVKTFEQLAEHHIADESKRADAIALAQSFEDGQKLAWTAEQEAPGGLKEHAEAFKAQLPRWGYTATINSAYRPILYQGHFADLRLCAIQLLHTLLEHPDLGPALAGSVAAVNAEVAKHAIKAETHNVAGLTVKVVFVCYKEPLTNCPHTDGRAVDMSITPDDGALDWVGAMSGMCRPYLKASTPDRPHWEYLGDSPFGNPKCNSLGPGPGQADIHISGNSPINLLLTDADGDQIGFDPVANESVNDFGESYAFYSGPGTHPQIIEVSSDVTSAGGYSITGVGTGAGDYTVSYTLIDEDGVDVDAGTVTGHATADAPINALNFTLKDDYWPKDVFTEGRYKSATGSSTVFSVDVNNTTHDVEVGGGQLDQIMYSSEFNVIAVKDDGAGGPTRITVPKGLLSGDFEVRVDGAVVLYTRTESASGTTLVFNRPAGGDHITVEGASGTGSSTPSAGPGGGDLTLILVVGVLAAVGAVGALVYMSRRNRKQPGAPPGAPPGAGPPPAP